MMKQILKNKKLALFGIIGPLVAICGIALAISQSSWFSWEDNALSDLGVSHITDAGISDASLFFNLGLIAGGAMLAIFISHVFIKIERGKLRSAGLLTLLMASIFLMLIGIFTEDYDPLHWQVSVSFFLLLLISMIILGISFSRDAEYRFFGIFAFVACFIGLASWFVDWGGGIAIPEAVSSFPICIWASLLALKFYRVD